METNAHNIVNTSCSGAQVNNKKNQLPSEVSLKAVMVPFPHIDPQVNVRKNQILKRLNTGNKQQAKPNGCLDV